MKNFEKFQNKQISEVETAKVMGGSNHTWCEGFQVSNCVATDYGYWQGYFGCSGDDSGCLDVACDLALLYCGPE